MLMLKTVTVLEAISKRRRTARPAAHTGLSKNTIFAATHSAEDALVLLDATANGLTVEQATERLNAVGPNTINPTNTTRPLTRKEDYHGTLESWIGSCRRRHGRPVEGIYLLRIDAC